VDIDIDFADRTVALDLFDHVVASRQSQDQFIQHPSGVYVTEIPHDVVTNLATIDYKEAERRGYLKIDLLNVSVYQGVKSPQHLDQLINQEPIWELLEYDEFTDQLFHLAGHGAILRKLKPTSILQLAAVLSVIRPAKRYLLTESWDVILSQVWLPTQDGYSFKKSHAVAYAMVVVVHMNLLSEETIPAAS
jgi:hypothetical protein